MKNLKEIELLIKELIDKANEQNIALSGAINTPDGQLLGFKNQVQGNCENMFNINSMVESKGDMSEFLCLVSKKGALGEFDTNFSNKALPFALSNPQVNNTRH